MARFGGLFGPIVFGVAAAYEFADIGVGGVPEIGEVLGHLGGATVGGAEVDEDGGCAGADAWQCISAECFLNFDAYDGRRKCIIDGRFVAVL